MLERANLLLLRMLEKLGDLPHWGKLCLGVIVVILLGMAAHYGIVPSIAATRGR